MSNKYVTADELENKFQREIRAIRRWERTKGFPPPVITASGAKNLWLREHIDAWEMSLAASWTPPEPQGREVG